MKLMPLLSAILVAGFLYLLVIERDMLKAFAQTAEADEAVQAEAPEAEARPAGIRVVARHSIAEIIENAVVLRGRTEAARQVTVAAETSGLVLSEPLRKGTVVAQGDLLCELAPGTRASALQEERARLAEAEGRVPEAQASVAEAQARVREAEINVNAARQLSEGGFASESRLVGAEATYEAAVAGVSRARAAIIGAEAGIEAAQAGVASAEAEIDRLRMHAPFSGLLETDTAELGSLMQPGSACATVIQLDPIKLVGFVPESELDQIEVGARASARLAGGRDLVGRVTFLSRSGDEMTRTFRLEIAVPNPDLRVRDGQTADIFVESAGQNAHLLPQSSLTLNDDGTLGVRTVDADNLAQFMPVTLLRDTVDGVWVSGLPEAVDVILVGQEYVIDGVAVRPVYPDAIPAADAPGTLPTDTAPGAAVPAPGPAAVTGEAPGTTGSDTDSAAPEVSQ